MTLTIWYKGDEDPVVIKYVSMVMLVSADSILVQCFGNDAVVHRNVSGYTATYNRVSGD